MLLRYVEPMAQASTGEDDRLIEILTANDWFMSVLRAVRDVHAPNSAVAAGAIRNVVWDHLHRYGDPTPVKDVDVPFFDPDDLSPDRDRFFEDALRKLMPELPWDAKNQARVHLWYEDKFGHPIEPIRSLHDGVGRNPETANSVAVRLRDDETLEVIAPCGPDDLLNMVLRRNPRQASYEYFLQRLREKRIQEKWPKVTVVFE